MFAADLFEPNETIETAAQIYTGDHEIHDLSIDTIDDNDYFEWQATADGQLHVDLLFSHQDGDLDMLLFNQEHHLVFHADSQDDNESATIEVIDGERYFVRVIGFQASNDNYTLKLDSPGEIQKDAYEFNETLVDASDLGSADQTIHNLTLHGEGAADHSHDYYKWTAVDTGMATVSIDFRHAFGDAKLEVFDNKGDFVDVSDSSTDGESIVFPVVRNQASYIKVSGFNFAPNPNYSLSIDGPDLPPDGFEPNDTVAAASPVIDGVYSNLSIHSPGNEDWYSYTPSIDGTLDVELAFDSSDGDIELEVYSGQILVASSVTTNDIESVSVPVVGGSTYSIRAFAHPLITSTDYSLTVDGPELQIPFTVDVLDVTPTSRSQPVDTIEFNFDRPVLSLDLANHLSLVRSNDVIAQVSLQTARLRSLGGGRWELGNLASLTSTSGIYDLTVGNLLTDIRDPAGNVLQNSDLTRWIQGAGDANLDGRFDSRDLISVFTANQYEDGVVGNSRWSTGDWDGDGEFSTSDLLVAFQAGWYSTAAAPARPLSNPLPATFNGIDDSDADSPSTSKRPRRMQADLVDQAIVETFDDSLFPSTSRAVIV